MIIDINHQLYKIQVKTSRPTTTNATTLVFNTVSSRMNHTDGNTKKKYSSDDCDFFATVFQDKVYLVPQEICQSSEKRLVDTTSKYANHQADLKSDYEALTVIQRILNNEPVAIHHSTVIAQYDLDGVFIAEYSTYAEAARSLPDASTKSADYISEAVNGKRDSYKDYIWIKEER